MGTKGEATRERVMEIAERLILQQGFASTSIEQTIQEANITKGGFFYHFDGKNELAIALMERYRKTDNELFGGLFERARELSEDPLQQMLIFVKLLSEMMSDIEGLHPGCLVASFTYESYQLNDDVRQIMSDSVMDWQKLFQQQLDRVEEKYPAKTDHSTRQLADLLSSIIEGGIVVSRVLNEPKILVDQLMQYRSHIQLIYAQA